jgi:16S rRNA processing protein RimM
VPASTSSWRSSPTSDRLAVGQIVGAKGLSGALRVEALTDFPERLQPDAQVYLEGEGQPRRIAGVEHGGRGLVLTLDGVASREAADALRGRYLEVEARSLPIGSYYWHELIGLAVETDDGQPLGTIREVFRAGEAEVYRVELTDGGELLLPGVRDVVREIDLGAGRMVVHYEAEEVR